MFEKVNPSHPDKVADRIAGALVDLAYSSQPDPKIAVEVLIGHGVCNIIAESSVQLDITDVEDAVHRIAGKNICVNYREYPQDIHLSKNQSEKVKCGDNGIFKGVPVSDEEKFLTGLVKSIYDAVPYDGKYIISKDEVIACQSNASKSMFFNVVSDIGGDYDVSWKVNPLGDWTGGTDVDSGATNRKLGSDMAQSVTGGGLHGKDLSKADVSVNIFAFAYAQMLGEPVELKCAIGDDEIAGIPYQSIVDFARGYIMAIGGFEKFAEWGLVR